MAANRKYAGLPDLDAAPEIYETPELTDDASTVQTSTLRTESPSPSEGGGGTENFDRANLNQEEARRRFEPAVVDTRNVNLSDAIGGNRKGYSATHRRRRRRRLNRPDGDGDGYGGYSDFSSSEEEETLSKKLARLRREAEEIQSELERREKEGDKGEVKDTVEQQHGGEQGENKDLFDGVEQLNQLLNNLRATSRSIKGETLEQEFSRHLTRDSNKTTSKLPAQTNGAIDIAGSVSSSVISSISAITAFSDRLTALESALGLSSTLPNTNASSIIPSLDNLTRQVNSLYSVIDPKTAPGNTQRDHLEILTDRLHVLHVDADRMLNTRKAALQALAQLHEARYNGSTHNSAAFAKYLTRREARGRQENETDQAGRLRSRSKSKDEKALRRVSSGHSAANAAAATTTTAAAEIDPSTIEDRIFTDVFLEEQSNKISALYNTLPTIESLQPLLPVVLERLRGLSVIHASASTAQQDMSAIETRLSEWEKELTKWRAAVEGVEKAIGESKTVMKENVEVVGDMVRGVEGRLDALKRSKT